MYILQFDGQFHEYGKEQTNPSRAGLMGYGWLIYKNNRQVARGWGAFAQGKNAASNIAEYLALIEGLYALRDMGVERETVEIIGDARSVIDQMLGCAAVSAPQARVLYQRASRIARYFRHLTWIWQPRRDNHAADQLTRRALRQVRSDRQSIRQALQAALQPRGGMTALFDLSVFSSI